ncbi:MAG: hypothetical protein NW224_30280 [Leptolyngbyaceae cyanobacterium bins.302]|nr:hypothetical protein [Leptolyngbyaceae cyanobacterium bins.302]
MSSAATLAPKDSKVTNTQFSDRSVRLLLVLWFLGGENVNQGELTKRVKAKGEKSKDCEKFFTELEKGRAIEVTSKKVSLTDLGKGALGHRLGNTDLGIEGTVVGSWMAKALLKWIQQSGVSSYAPSTNGNGKAVSSAIASYEEFKPVALEVYDRLNRDYNLDNLVPIYRIRREIGDQVSRSQFNDWMLDLQANDVLQLIGGEMPSLTPDKAEDSIETKLGGMRYYVKLL